MELSWSTFVLEIVNFLVLVWMLQRFLYRPILHVITQRKAAIDQTKADAEALRQEADALQEQYANRLAEWEQEKAKARAQLHHDLDAERSRLMSKLLASLEEERAKARVLEERRRSDVQRQSEARALAHATQFVTRLLSRVAGPALESTLVALVVEELAALPEDTRQRLRNTVVEAQQSLLITSAYPLNELQREQLRQGLTACLGQPIACAFVEDRQLLAGLRIGLGSWVLQANLQDELKFFAHEMTHVA